MQPKVLVLNGPNLNLLGTREPEVYGRETLADIEKQCQETGRTYGLEVDFRQTNAEHELIGWVQEAGNAAAIVINPAAYSHTSIALLDALKAYDGPVIEVHLSNTYKREAFRHTSYVSLRADAVIAGCGAQGYALALMRAATLTS